MRSRPWSPEDGDPCPGESASEAGGRKPLLGEGPRRLCLRLHVPPPRRAERRAVSAAGAAARAPSPSLCAFRAPPCGRTAPRASRRARAPPAGECFRTPGRRGDQAGPSEAVLAAAAPGAARAARAADNRAVILTRLPPCDYSSPAGGSLQTPDFCQDLTLRPVRQEIQRLPKKGPFFGCAAHREMKGQQKTAETEEGTVQIQEGAVATGEDPTSVAIASIQSSATFPDPNVKYVFRAENGGQVMYRVIQVSEGQLDGQTEGTGAISGYPAAQSMTQAVIQGAFTSDEAADTEGTAAETHYAYFPGAAVGDGAGTAAGSAAAVVTTQGSEALLGQATPPGTGQFFVMMSPQEVLQGGSQRSIAPRTHPYSPKSEAPRTTRDEKRRAQHNEVERRRRDKINNWIVQLSKIIPDCSMESTKSGQSKGGILSKACDYIQELRQSNHRLSEELQGLDQLQLDNEVLRQQVEDLKNKNLLLRAQLRHHGVEVVIKSDSS